MPRILAVIFFLLNRQQRSVAIYPPSPVGHKELPYFAQLLSQSKGIPDKTSCHSTTHVNIYDAAKKTQHLGRVSAH